MRYIKKMFEFSNKQSIPDDEQDLVELFSQKFIEEYFDDSFEIGAAEAAQQVNLWNFVNIDGVRTALIKEIAEDTETDNKNFSNTDYIDFIKEKKLESEEVLLHLLFVLTQKIKIYLGLIIKLSKTKIFIYVKL